MPKTHTHTEATYRVIAFPNDGFRVEGSILDSAVVGAIAHGWIRASDSDRR